MIGITRRRIYGALIGLLVLSALLANAASLDLNAQSLTPSDSILNVPKSQPTVTLQASAGGVVGTALTDSATLSDGTANMGGLVYFTLWGPSASAVCTTKVSEVSSVVNGNGLYTSPSVTPTASGSYYWTVRYVGDPNNENISETACGAPNQSVTVSKATPTVTTTASPASLTVGGTAADSATISGAYNPTGTLTFKLYPSSDATCSGTPVFTNTKSVTANASYQSDAYTTTAAGSYKWQATYSGDANNNQVVHTCGGVSETLTVTKATPSLLTQATTTVTVGQSVTDTATLANSYSATGTITYKLYGPSDTQACTTLVGTVTKSVSGNGAYTSPSITPPHAGTYWWIANYGGDSNNDGTTNACGESDETSTVAKATPSFTVSATPSSVTVGGAAADQAVMTGGFNPTGTITFKLFAATDTSCTGAVAFTSSKTVNGNSTYTSDSFTTNAAGSYKWWFSYAGDGDNQAVTQCGGANESLTVNKATPSVSTTPSSGVVVGGQVSDAATIVNGYNATGTVDFLLYSNAACSAQVFSSAGRTVTSNAASSTSYSTSAPGTYYWKAVYSGDSNNTGYTTTCGGVSDEQVVVSKASPSLSTTPSPGVVVGGQVSDSATLTGGYNATGTVSFFLYSDAACATQVFSSLNRPLTSSAASSTSFTTTTPGTYYWKTTYSGDTNNNMFVSSCGGASDEQVVVSKGSPTLSTTPSGTVAVGGQVSDVATITGGATPTGSVDFFLYSNTACTTQVFSSTGRTITSGSASSASYTTTAAGTFYWKAVYSGDANNNGFTSSCGGPSDEKVVVTAAATSKLHIVSITGVGTRSGNSANYDATLTVTVADQLNNVVGTVVVSGGWSSPGPAQDECTTGGAGTCQIATTTIDTSPITWTVSNLAKPGYTYDSSANLKNSIECSRSADKNGATTCVAS